MKGIIMSEEEQRIRTATAAADSFLLYVLLLY